MRPLPLVERLDLHLRHVDAGRAFAPAALAAHAQVERVAHRLRLQRVGAELARQREPQRVGAAARQMLLVARDAIARAHRAGIELAAVAVVVAHFDGLREAAGGIAAGAGRRRRVGDRIALHVPRDQSSAGTIGTTRYDGGKRNSVASSIRVGRTILPGFVGRPDRTAP